MYGTIARGFPHALAPLFRRFGWLLLAAAVASCGGSGGESDEAALDEGIPFRKDGELTFSRSGEPVVTIDIELADTDSARQRGLMQRTSLPSNSGMLFIFPTESTQSFWMANTPLALDLLFVDADSQIVDIEKYTTPFSSLSITSDAAARFVIEVPAGFVDTHGLTEGDDVSWRRTDET